MLASNRVIEEIIKSVPDTIRSKFINATNAGATNQDIEKLFAAIQNFMDDYQRTLIEDSTFYKECTDNPYLPGVTVDYTYPHFLHVLKMRLEAASSLEERELLRRQHYDKLSEYKFSDSVVLSIVTDKLSMGLATPTWIESFFSRLTRSKPKPADKKPAITYTEKKLEQTSA